MLQELYNYALDHQLTVLPGFKPKKIKAYVCLDRQAQFLGIDSPPDVPVQCPDLGSLAQGPDKCNLLVEKALIPLSEEKPKKRAFFLQALADGAAVEPLFDVLRTALTCPDTVKDINNALEQTQKNEKMKMKIKPSDIIGYKVDGQALEGLASYRSWWSAYAAEQRGAAKNTRQERCLITGELTEPLRTAPKVAGLRAVGGHSSGDAVICFDKDAFCSYGKEQGANAPVSEAAMAAVNAALDDLLNRQKAPALSGAKWLHWYKCSLPQEVPDYLDDLFSIWGSDSESEDAADNGSQAATDDKTAAESDVAQLSIAEMLATEAPATESPAAEEPSTAGAETLQSITARQRADALLQSPFSGQMPADLSDNEYYILSLSGAAGRVMVRGWQQGSFAQLQQAMQAWWDDLALISPDGRSLLRRPRLGQLSIRLLKQPTSSNLGEQMSKELAGLQPRLIASILNQTPLPDQVAAKALQTIRSKMLRSDDSDTKSEPLPDARACQLLKVWLLRRHTTDKGGPAMQPELNAEYSSAAYHCGRLMAVFAAIQSAALGNVGAGVLQRYYTSASCTPALVLGRLSALCQHHLSKLDNPALAGYYEKLLGEIAQKIKMPLPATLDLRGQSEFALGYYQQRAALFAPRKNNNNTDTVNE